MREILENRPENYRVLFQVLALTGARTGEVSGLQWKHADLEKAQLRIEQSLWHGLLVAPKTRESVRIINTSVVLLRLKWCFKVLSSFPNLSHGLSEYGTQSKTRLT
jgi:integrase